MRESKLEALFKWQLMATGCPEHVREYRFDAVRRWRFDFAWPELRFAVEVDGGEYVQGRHSRAAGMRGDNEKMNAATAQGWRVFRWTGAQVRSGQAIAATERYLLGCGHEEKAPRSDELPEP